MNNTNKPIELVIPFDKEVSKFILKIMPLPILFLASILFLTFATVNPQATSFLEVAIVPVIRCVLVFLIALLLLTTIQLFFYIKNPDPLAILNQDGIRVKGFGFVSWKNIDKVALYSTAHSGEFELVGIHVKNFYSLLKQAPWGGKVGICSAKMFGQPPVSISSRIISNDEVIQFAQQFIPKKEFFN